MLKWKAKDWGLFYLSFKGKLKRREFFLGYLSLLVFYYIALKFIRPMGDGGEANLNFGAQNLIFFSCFSYMAFALSVKRLRDLNRSRMVLPALFYSLSEFLFLALSSL